MKKVFLIIFLALGTAGFAHAQEATPQSAPQEFQLQDLNNIETENNADILRHRRYICYAESIQGQYFRGISWDRSYAQRLAMNTCFHYSHLCRPLGCQYTNW